MCGAFSIVLTPRTWGDFFHVPEPAKWQSVYNARPGEILPIITQQEPKTTSAALWNYVPHWLKEPKAREVINARAEGITDKPFFRDSMQKKRCIIPADGFYEWARQGKLKVPYRFVHRDGMPFGFAGLYDEAPDQNGSIGFAIITTSANELVGKIHDRMPVILDRNKEQDWLDASVPAAQAVEFLVPFPATAMNMFQVSRRVNIAANNDASVIEPV